MAPKAEGTPHRVRVAALLLIAGLATVPVDTHVYWMLGGTWGLHSSTSTGIRVVAAVVVVQLVAAVLVVLAPLPGSSTTWAARSPSSPTSIPTRSRGRSRRDFGAVAAVRGPALHGCRGAASDRFALGADYAAARAEGESRSLNDALARAREALTLAL